MFNVCHLTILNADLVDMSSLIEETQQLTAGDNPDEGRSRLVRIVTTELPRYFAIMTRCRLETATVGSHGGLLSSTVEPQVQAVFPEGALMKTIKVGLQVGLLIVLFDC